MFEFGGLCTPSVWCCSLWLLAVLWFCLCLVLGYVCSDLAVSLYCLYLDILFFSLIPASGFLDFDVEIACFSLPEWLS